MDKAQRGVEKRQEKGNIRVLNKIASVLQLPAAVIAGVSHMEVSRKSRGRFRGLRWYYSIYRRCSKSKNRKINHQIQWEKS